MPLCRTDGRLLLFPVFPVLMIACASCGKYQERGREEVKLMTVSVYTQLAKSEGLGWGFYADTYVVVSIPEASTTPARTTSLGIRTTYVMASSSAQCRTPTHSVRARKSQGLCCGLGILQRCPGCIQPADRCRRNTKLFYTPRRARRFGDCEGPMTYLARKNPDAAAGLDRELHFSSKSRKLVHLDTSSLTWLETWRPDELQCSLLVLASQSS